MSASDENVKFAFPKTFYSAERLLPHCNTNVSSVFGPNILPLIRMTEEQLVFRQLLSSLPDSVLCCIIEQDPRKTRELLISKKATKIVPLLQNYQNLSFLAKTERLERKITIEFRAFEKFLLSSRKFVTQRDDEICNHVKICTTLTQTDATALCNNFFTSGSLEPSFDLLEKWSEKTYPELTEKRRELILKFRESKYWETFDFVSLVPGATEPNYDFQQYHLDLEMLYFISGGKCRKNFPEQFFLRCTKIDSNFMINTRPEMIATKLLGQCRQALVQQLCAHFMIASALSVNDRMATEHWLEVCANIGKVYKKTSILGEFLGLDTGQADVTFLDLYQSVFLESENFSTIANSVYQDVSFKPWSLVDISRPWASAKTKIPSLRTVFNICQGFEPVKKPTVESALPLLWLQTMLHCGDEDEIEKSFAEFCQEVTTEQTMDFLQRMRMHQIKQNGREFVYADKNIEKFDDWETWGGQI